MIFFTGSDEKNFLKKSENFGEKLPFSFCLSSLPVCLYSTALLSSLHFLSPHKTHESHETWKHIEPSFLERVILFYGSSFHWLEKRREVLFSLFSERLFLREPSSLSLCLNSTPVWYPSTYISVFSTLSVPQASARENRFVLLNSEMHTHRETHAHITHTFTHTHVHTSSST